MTRKEYKAIADVISKSNKFGQIDTVDLVTSLAVVLKKDNPNFNFSSFRDACLFREDN